MAFSNDISYSNSRNEKFRGKCLRQYYLHYYGSWNGWGRNASEIKKKTYFLKKLNNRYAWAGTLLHEAIAKMLKHFKDTGEIISPEDLKAQTYDKMKVQWNQSLERKNTKIAKQFGLREHEFNHRVSDDDWKKIRDRAFNGIDAFYQSELFDEIMDVPTKDWLYIDDDSFNTFTVQAAGKKLKVFSIPDFAMRKPDGTVAIYDWKTGKPKKTHRGQLALYALYAVSFWDVKPEEVEIILFYSGVKKVERDTVTQEDINSASDDIKEFVKDISKKLVDGDIDKNVPLKIEGTDQDDLSIWPLTDNTGDCFFCDYESICGIRKKMNV